MDNEHNIIYQEESQHEFLTTYQQDQDHGYDWEVRRQRAKARVNYLALCVLKDYRRNLKSSGVSRKAFLPDIRPISTLPVEIIFEILEYLHPIDLLHLTKTIKTCRDLLKNCSSTSVWKSAFANYSEIPEIPPCITGHRWADLLFGPYICEKCGGSPALPDITFCRRLCNECDNKEFIKIHKFMENTEGGSRIRDLAKPTQIILVDPFNETALEDLQYSPPSLNRAEVDDITSTLLQLESSIENRTAGAEAALERYKVVRQELVNACITRNEACVQWAEFYRRRLFGETERTVILMMRKIEDRFKRLGFIAADVDSAIFKPKILKDLVNITGITRLTRRRWTKLQPLLEPAIAAATQERLDQERRKLILERTEFLKEGYRKYSKSCLPSTWAYLPPFYAVKHFDPISRLINAPHDHPLVEADLLESFSLLHQEIDNWTASKMKQLVSFLPGSCSPVDELAEDIEGPHPPELSPLSLATSVFHCHGSRQNSIRMGGCLIGWDGAAPHLRCRALEYYWEKRLHFTQRGQDAASSLVELVGLNPAITKIWEMDELDKRFVCLTCPTERLKGRKVYEWHNAVHHSISTDGDDVHNSLSWGLLGPDAEADIKAREGPDPYIWDKKWTCNHCPAHFENMVIREAAINHAKEIHDIAKPISNVDYAYYAGDRTYRTPLYLPEVNPRGFACLRCASTKCRLYRLSTLTAHLKDAHGLSAPVEGVDWKRINILLRSSHGATSGRDSIEDGSGS